MQRALSLELLTKALGAHPRLPSPDELRSLLVRAEIGLFTGGREIPADLLDVAWYLHAVAGARDDLHVYPLERRRRAHQVAGHIFDLHLQALAEANPAERLRYTFAAQVGYIGGELTPNAAAIAARNPFVEAASVASKPHEVSLQAGIMLLALDRVRAYPELNRWRDELSSLAQEWSDISASPYAAVDGVVRGCRQLLSFLVYGDTGLLRTARERLAAAVAAPAAQADLDSRWVAAHLLGLAEDLGSASVWTAIPPSMPAGAARAMTVGDPPVLMLWPPQLRFMEPSEGVSPLERATRRLVLSFPTSAGKTMLAQLIVVCHVASGPGDACIVAPTHSLCREIRSGLDRRLATLGTRAVDSGPLGVEAPSTMPARAVVMTPEKLAALIHADPARVLDQFSLFVIDEAHLIAEGERGWRLEESVSLLHYLTKSSGHRIVVLSAALGNRAHILRWLDPGGGVVDRHDDWRGPRRLHAVYTTRAEWDEKEAEPPAGRRAARELVPLRGVVHLRTGDHAAVPGSFRDPVGRLVRRQKRNGEWTKDEDASTSQRSHLVPLVQHVARTGPVLVIQATRSQCTRLAEEIAEHCEEHTPTRGLAELAQIRVEEGPLARVLRRGVAFHHSALPTDVQSEIEEAARAGRIRILVATTTLTEGVNLPFKTVIVGERGWGSGETRVELIDPARLVNAVGRAGRAGRETEGWLVLAEQRIFETGLFAPFDVTAEDLDLRSTLTNEAALEALAEFEVLLAAGEDAVFANTGTATADFCSYVWFVADALGELHGSVTREDVFAAVKTTLAWQQLDDATRARWLDVAGGSLNTYERQPVGVRRRWARTGASLGTARVLEGIAQEVAAAVRVEGSMSVQEMIDVVLGNGRLDRLLRVAENRSRGFKRRRTDAASDLIDVDVLSLLHAWVAGDGLETLANRYLAEVGDDDYRSEQLSEFIAGVFEHHIPWTLATVVEWANDQLAQEEVGIRIAESLSGHVHFGVPTATALEMAIGGVRSRRLAVRASAAHAALGAGEDVRDWLVQSDIAQWRQELDASPTELADLLSFVRAPGAQLVATLLDGNPVSVPYVADGGHPVQETDAIEVSEASDEPEPKTLRVFGGDHLIGQIGPGHHDHVKQILSLGVPVEVSVSPTEPGLLKMALGQATE